jgi:uncharacterized SAM-dependent methyltransferase
VLIEPGSGSSEKVRLLLDSLQPTAYVPLDISAGRRIEMHLVSKESQTVKVNGSAIDFRKGETLHTENSYKYSLEDFAALSDAAGFTLKKSWQVKITGPER